MTRHRVLLGAILILLLVSIVPTTIAQEETAQEVIHVVLHIDGEATISRLVGASEYADPLPLTVGSLIRTTDVIASEGRVAVLCSDQSVKTIENTSASSGCPDVTNDNSVSWGTSAIHRSTRSASGPYALSPRNSVLMNAQPDFVWTAYEEAGATVAYQLQLIRLNDATVLWEANNISGTRIAFPLTAPLQANDPRTGETVQYQLRVTPIINSQPRSVIDSADPRGFCVIDPRDRPTVTQLIDQVRSVPLPDWVPSEARQFNLAAFYYDRALYNDALQTMLALLPVPLTEEFPANLVDANNLAGSPSFYILLGNIYYSMRLPGEMRLAFERANALAEQLSDSAALARISEQRASIERAGAPVIVDPAVGALYDRAISLYTEIGDTDAAERVRVSRDERPVLTDFSPCETATR